MRSSVRLSDNRLLLLAGPVIGFPDQVGNSRKAGGNFLLSSGHSDGLFHQRRHRRPIERSQSLLIGRHFDEFGKLLNRLLIFVHDAVEVCPDLEYFAQVFIIVAEQMVEVGIGNQNDFDI